MTICPNCGLPLEACVCQEIAEKQQEITIRTEKRRFGKMITLVRGLEGIDMENMLKKLKGGLACGGTIKNGEIELQGNHKNKIRKVLLEEGFDDSQIKD
jgi:translation initiation factor 1